MTAIKERPIPSDMAKRIIKGPHIIQRIQTEALESDIEDAAVVVKKIINEEAYPLSDRQLEIVFTSAPRLVEHKKGRNLARDMRLKDAVAFKAEAAQQCNFPPTLADIVFHPSSITFRLESESFRSRWDEHRKEIQAQNPTEYPIGFTTYKYLMDLGNVPHLFQPPMKNFPIKHTDRN